MKFRIKIELFFKLPSNNAEKVTISGLSPNEKYIFAVCAYDKNGTLIGDSIGDSTDPILASNTLSILMNWAYLCQVNMIFSKKSKVKIIL
jgi:hypothetical protein